jgi:hypothetical protein
MLRSMPLKHSSSNERQDREDAFRPALGIAKLAREAPEIDRSFSVFLAQAYKYKEISDYGVGPGAVITMAEAHGAVTNAARLIDCITTLLGKNGS